VSTSRRRSEGVDKTCPHLDICYELDSFHWICPRTWVANQKELYKKVVVRLWHRNFLVGFANECLLRDGRLLQPPLTAVICRRSTCARDCFTGLCARVEVNHAIYTLAIKGWNASCMCVCVYYVLLLHFCVVHFQIRCSGATIIGTTAQCKRSSLMPTVFIIIAFMDGAILTKKLPSLIKWREGRDRLARM